MSTRETFRKSFIDLPPEEKEKFLREWEPIKREWEPLRDAMVRLWIKYGLVAPLH